MNLVRILKEVYKCQWCSKAKSILLSVKWGGNTRSTQNTD